MNVAHLEHEEWMRGRKRPTKETLAKALKLLDQGGKNPPEPGDELPAGYRRMATGSRAPAGRRQKRA